MKPVITQSVAREFTELELCMDRYFNLHIMPVMQAVQEDLSHRQFKETEDYKKTMGPLTPAPGTVALQMDTVMRHVGEWNGKTAEDYLAMCRKELGRDPSVSVGLSALSGLWRRELIDLIGREQYDSRSSALGRDLADAYISYRMDRRMVDTMISQEMPKSSMEYIIRKGMDESLLGLLSGGLHKSPLENYVSDASDKAYGPTILEKGAGKALAFGSDLMTTGGFGSWASVGRLVACEAVFEGGKALYEGMSPDQGETSVEQIISREVFGSDSNILGQWQAGSRDLFPDTCGKMRELDEILEGRMKLLSPAFVEKMHLGQKFPPLLKDRIDTPLSVTVPFVPGYDPNHPERFKAPTKPATTEDTGQESASVMTNKGITVLDEEVREEPPQQSTDGWGSLLSGLGLGDIGAVGRNMGYVISMLPDVMAGLFSGKTRSLELKDNMLPLASIMVGLFIRNPLLKTVLIGMGGMNLLNKAGHEAIEDKKISDGVVSSGAREFLRYEDQPLNDRIRDPEIRGGSLFAVLDGTPCTIRLPEHTLAAWQSGSLPLNTLANAVLSRSDEMSRIAQERYEESETRELSRGRNL